MSTFVFTVYQRLIYLLMLRKITSICADKNEKQLSLPRFGFKTLTIGCKISTSLKTVFNLIFAALRA
jgi:hypothetical protein